MNRPFRRLFAPHKPFVGLFEIIRVPGPQGETSPYIARYGEQLFLKEVSSIIKQKHSLADQIFGIGRYTYLKDRQLYFVHGKSRIKVTEHFPVDGKPLDMLLEDLIQFSARQQDNDQIHPVCQETVPDAAPQLKRQQISTEKFNESMGKGTQNPYLCPFFTWNDAADSC